MSDRDSMTPRDVLVWGLAKRLARGESRGEVRKLIGETLPDYETETVMEDAQELAESEDMMDLEGVLSDLDST